MADLKTKLGRLSTLGMGPPGGFTKAIEPPPRVAEAEAAEGVSERLQALRSRLANFRGRSTRRPAPAAVLPELPGAEEITAHGPLHVVSQWQTGDYCHGTVPLSACLLTTGAHLATLALDTALSTLDPRRLLFLDTETTGLAGGAGTVPFLVGLSWFEAGSWHMEQLLLRRPGEEAPLLRRVAERLEGASGIVTYNGKSFDWPLIKTRFVLNRLPAPPLLPHVDLLHCTRRVLRRRQATLRLVHVEQALLGHHRQGDIDGADIPATYFSFLRGAPASTLTPIITHNAHDLWALAALMGVLGRFLEAPEACAHAADRLCVAELMGRAGAHDRALDYALAAAADVEGEVAGEALMLVARLHSQQQNWHAAAEALHGAVAATGDNPVHHAAVHLSLAKLYEHRLGDTERALQHAARSVLAEGRDSHLRRLARLRRRGDVSAASPPRPAG